MQLPIQYSATYCKTLLFCIYMWHYIDSILQQYERHRRYANIPPGPKPWPIVGNFGGFLAGLMEMSKLYGNIFSIFVGPQLMVVLTGYETVWDAMLNHPEVFSDRPQIPLVTIITKRKGKISSHWIVFALYGPLWRTNRKFCHSTLRSFGFGKLSLEPCIYEGLTMIKTELQSLIEKAGPSGIDLTPLISNAVSNVISSMSLGQHFHHQDQEFRTMLDLMSHGLEINVSTSILFRKQNILFHETVIIIIIILFFLSIIAENSFKYGLVLLS
uniref:Cytochrome P450, family 2, subfamily U, polypeptide 1 n=1 Tax=Sinocyclocheilus anshuiensis TaxID=1608454 RepID=A0A671SIX4_9TELE